MAGVSGYTQIVKIDTQANLPTTATKGDFAYTMDTGLLFAWDGTAWQASNKVLVKKTGTTVNGKNATSTAIYTLEASSLNFYPIMTVPRNVNISGVTTGPTASIGTNSPSFNNIASSSLLTTVLATLGVGNGVPQMTSFSPALAGGAQISVNVTIGAVATNYSFKLDIIGFYDA